MFSIVMYHEEKIEACSHNISPCAPTEIKYSKRRRGGAKPHSKSPPPSSSPSSSAAGAAARSFCMRCECWLTDARRILPSTRIDATAAPPWASSSSSTGGSVGGGASEHGSEDDRGVERATLELAEVRERAGAARRQGSHQCEAPAHESMAGPAA